MISAIMVIILGYVFGSIPTGFWVAKANGVDIRTMGSGSTGATNVWRCVGKVAGTAVFTIDVLKGYVPVLIAVLLDQGMQATEWAFTQHWVAPLVALATLIGHSKSIFLKFQGGKSAATGLGTLFALQPMAAFITFVIWITLVKTTRIVSLASIIAVFASGCLFALFQAPLPYTIYCFIGFVYITYRHKANIKRLMNGTEPRLGDKPKDLTQ